MTGGPQIPPFDPARPLLFREHAWHGAGDGVLRTVADPATLEPVGVVGQASGADIDLAVARANQAHRGWARTDAKSRATLLHRVADSIEHSDPRIVCELLTREMGKPYVEAVGEQMNIAAAFRYYAEMARDDAGKLAGTTQVGSFQFMRQEPYGVSVHITPYNFPLLILGWTVAASLAAGNACICKPSELTTLSTMAFMRHFAALPPGLVACLPGDGRVGAALVAHHDTHVVAFTGSVAVGKVVGVACAERMKPAVIEAGGSDPMIIAESAPLDVAVPGAITAAFHLTGQICTSAERFYVVDAVHDAFVTEFARQTQRLTIGNGMDPVELGPMVSEAARAKAMAAVEGALAEGATLVTGGRIPPGRNTGWFYEPTILVDVHPDMAILQEEVFGPVAAICRVRDFDEALSLANRSRYGLGASVFTTRMDEAMRAADVLQAGMVWVNNPLIDNDALPFGGWKMSGVGRELGRQGLDAFRQPKMVIIDPVPVRQDWWYPYDPTFFAGRGQAG